MESPARLPVVYVAGPYRAETPAGIELNIAAARAMGLQAIRRGWSPIIPHCNCALLDLVAPSIGDAFWLAATMELMRRADVVLLIPGWENSSGTQAEVREAKRLNIPVLTLGQLEDGAEYMTRCAKISDLRAVVMAGSQA